jgi:hypothetical protein
MERGLTSHAVLRRRAIRRRAYAPEFARNDDVEVRAGWVGGRGAAPTDRSRSKFWRHPHHLVGDSGWLTDRRRVGCRGADGLPTSEHTQVQTRRSPDGTLTTTIKVWAQNGLLIREDSTTVHPNPQPDPDPPTSTVPTPPTPAPVTGGSPADIITPTTRVPDSTLAGGGGWVGSGGTAVEHWKDWWLETPDGKVTFLGSTPVIKEE